MRRDVRAELRGILPEDKMSLVPRSFDVIGSKHKAVAIIEFPKGLKGLEDSIAQAIMKIHKNVTSVLAKESGRTGEYRIRALRLVAGDSNTEVLHKESGCLFRLDPSVVYFSPRECAERERITTAVGLGEEVLVMFSGIGSLPICITKRHVSVRATAVEFNPHAHNYCIENIHLNRLADRIEAIQGDVRDICPRLNRLYDRILMPLPKGAYKFLDIAIPLLKEEGILQFYHWAPEEDLYMRAEGLVIKAVKKEGRSAEFINRVRVSQYSPRVWKIRLDVRVRAL
jgi:tRNA (guanine37-N1)-methyltransferase